MRRSKEQIAADEAVLDRICSISERFRRIGIRCKAFDPGMRGAIEIFYKTLAEPLERIFHDNKDIKIYLSRQNSIMTVFMEYVGPNSFAGVHVPGDPMELVLFDTAVDRRGMMTPRDFVKTFGHLRIAKVVYEGNFNTEFIQDVRNGKYDVIEGVVAKGLRPTGKPPHNIWMAKVKTLTWLNKLRGLAESKPELFGKVLGENVKEQTEE